MLRNSTLAKGISTKSIPAPELERSFEMHQLDGTNYKGARWMDEIHTGPDGFGLLCIPFGCKGPVGNHMYGKAVRLVLSNPSESKGRIQSKLYFHACYSFFGLGLTCTPYNLPPGGIPFITYNEKDTILFLPPTEKVAGADRNYPGFSPPTCDGSTSGNANIPAATPIDPGTLGELQKAAINVGTSRGYTNAPNSVPLLLKACSEQGITDPGQLAYVLATAQRESSLGAATNEDPSTCFKSNSEGFCGRGLVQITNRDAYLKVGQRIGLGDKLVTNPNLANNPQIGAKIACNIFKGGITGDGRSLAQNIPPGTSGQALFDGWYRSRWIINNNDRAPGGTPTDIANSARGYYDALVKAQNSAASKPSTPDLTAPDPKSRPTPTVTVTSMCTSPPISPTDVKPFDGVKSQSGWCDPLPGGIQTHPFGEVRDGGRLHKGIDIAGPNNATIFAAADGTVIDREDRCPPLSWGCGDGFGNLVALRHPDKNAFTLYAHNLKPLVGGINSQVRCGQSVSIQGNTGSSKGDHLHFQVGTSGFNSGVISPKSAGVPNMRS